MGRVIDDALTTQYRQQEEEMHELKKRHEKEQQELSERHAKEEEALKENQLTARNSLRANLRAKLKERAEDREREANRRVDEEKGDTPETKASIHAAWQAAPAPVEAPEKTASVASEKPDLIDLTEAAILSAKTKPTCIDRMIKNCMKETNGNCLSDGRLSIVKPHNDNGSHEVYLTPDNGKTVYPFCDPSFKHVFTAALSPDMRLFAVGGHVDHGDGWWGAEVAVWRSESLKWMVWRSESLKWKGYKYVAEEAPVYRLRPCSIHESAVMAIEFSKDGKTLKAVTNQRDPGEDADRVVYYDLETGKRKADALSTPETKASIHAAWQAAAARKRKADDVLSTQSDAKKAKKKKAKKAKKKKKLFSSGTKRSTDGDEQALVLAFNSWQNAILRHYKNEKGQYRVGKDLLLTVITNSRPWELMKRTYVGRLREEDNNEKYWDLLSTKAKAFLKQYMDENWEDIVKANNLFPEKVKPAISASKKHGLIRDLAPQIATPI